ncbi:MAG: type I 3-dehydroquinate dehydratase [bacterium]|nr:type I 3-dehydroquinate dehydratase [bacterium]
MAESALLIGSLTGVPEPAVQTSAWDLAWALEWRADLLGEVDAATRGAHGDRRWIYTLRSRAEGGRGPSSPLERRERLCAAGESFDLIDLEAERDLGPEVLAAVPAEKRIISWHGDPTERHELRQRFETMAETPARFYKLVPAADRPSEAIAPLSLLHSLQREDVIAFASGESGVWSRLLAPRLGAPVVYARAQSEPAAPGQVSLATLRDDYGLPGLDPVSKLFGVVGRPVLHSLSPRLHNLMYRKLGLDRLYVPFHVPMFGDFWLDVVESESLGFLGFELCGLSVTAPFKEIAMAVAGAVSPRAEHIGAANSLAKRGQVWEAECTDPDGVVAPLLARGLRVKGARAAVLGAGGAGRAALDGLSSEGAEVTLANRSPRRGRRVALELGVTFAPLNEFVPERYDILINATPLGADDSDLPFDPERLAASATVVDLAYRHDGETPLVKATRASGRTAVDGKEVLLYQAAPQFEWVNGLEFDLELARAALGLEPLVSA